MDLYTVKEMDRLHFVPKLPRRHAVFRRPELSSGYGIAHKWKGGGMITVEAKKVGARVIATVKVGIGTGQYTYTVQFADQGSDAENEAEAQRALRKTLEEVLEALGP